MGKCKEVKIMSFVKRMHYEYLSIIDYYRNAVQLFF